MPMIASTSISSTNVNPLWMRFRTSCSPTHPVIQVCSKHDTVATSVGHPLKRKDARVVGELALKRHGEVPNLGSLDRRCRCTGTIGEDMRPDFGNVPRTDIAERP